MATPARSARASAPETGALPADEAYARGPAVAVSSVQAAPGGANTPQPTPALPDDVAELVAEANDVFERAQQLLQQGDFAGYGQEIDRLEEILRRLVELTEE